MGSVAAGEAWPRTALGSGPLPAEVGSTGLLARADWVTSLHSFPVTLPLVEMVKDLNDAWRDCLVGYASSPRMLAEQTARGRLDDAFTHSPGIRIHSIVFRSPLTRCRSITAYQVCQTPRGAEIAVIAAEPFDREALEREIEAGLAGVGLPRPRVTMQERETIPRTSGGQKLRRFVPLPDRGLLCRWRPGSSLAYSLISVDRREVGHGVGDHLNQSQCLWREG